MYTPKHFEVRDRGALMSLMERFSFATLVTASAAVPVATHLPFLIRPDAGEGGVLLSHMARANDQWRSFGDGTEALAIFQGHHTYISPSWYRQHPSVPTWNYMVVHAYGVPCVVEEHEAVAAILRGTVEKHEAGFDRPWSMDSLPEEYVRKMIRGIVAFEIPLTRLEGKFKLSQNRPAADRQEVVAALSRSPDPVERELARVMEGLG